MSWSSGTVCSSSEFFNQIGRKYFTYLIIKNGSYYEAYDKSGKLTYGGSGSLGGADGTNIVEVLQKCIDAIASGGGGYYGGGGVIFIKTGVYYGTGTIYIPSTDSGIHNIDLTIQGEGSSQTELRITSTGQVFDSQLASWYYGTYGPKLHIKDLAMYITVNTSLGSGAILDWYYFVTFLENVKIKALLTMTGGNLGFIGSGGAAGPSLPAIWDNVRVDVELTASNQKYLGNVIYAWHEGFIWRGGRFELKGPAAPGVTYGAYNGISLMGGGPKVLECIDNYSGTHVYYYIRGEGTITLNSLEYQDPTLIDAAHIAFFDGIVVNNTTAASAVNFGVNISFHLDPTATLKFSGIGGIGKITNCFYVPGAGQARLGLGDAAVPVANTDYRVQMDLSITVSGGTGVNISILDDKGNTLITGLATLSFQHLTIGHHINFGNFTVAPTIVVSNP